jgi:hypothetical protein
VLTEYTFFELPAARAKCKMIEAENVDQLVSVLRDELKII